MTILSPLRRALTAIALIAALLVQMGAVAHAGHRHPASPGPVSGCHGLASPEEHGLAAASADTAPDAATERDHGCVACQPVTLAAAPEAVVRSDKPAERILARRDRPRPDAMRNAPRKPPRTLA